MPGVPAPPPSAPRTDPESAWWEATGVAGLTALLFWCWDPIGVNDAYPAAQDEYAAYARALAPMLRAGAREDAVEAYLRDVEENAITVSAGAARRRDVAVRIVAWHRACVSRLRVEAGLSP